MCYIIVNLSLLYTFKHKIDNFGVKFKLWTFYDIAMTSKVSFVYNWPVELGLGRNWHKDRVMTISEVSREEIWEFFSRLFSIMKASLVTAIVLLKTSKAKIEANFFFHFKKQTDSLKDKIWLIRRHKE